MNNPHWKAIDVRTRQIVQVGFTPGLEYATLSYVWGPVVDMWMLKNPVPWARNAQGQLQCALPDALPQTLEDAIRVAAGLNLQYLWIDAVCIVQNDPADQAAQIGAMYHIYSQAHINLIAAAGENSHAGLPGVSTPRAFPDGTGVAIRDGVYVGVPRPRLNQQLKSSRWMTRGWTYQEVILPRRSLFFTDTEVFFFCGKSTAKESHVECPNNETWGEGDNFMMANAPIMHATREEDTLDSLIRMYCAAVTEYTGRQLTYATDILNAFDGIAAMLGGFFDCEMMWACPHQILVTCLTWSPPLMSHEPWPQRRRVPDEGHMKPLFPSWAWVAWSGAVTMSTPDYFERSEMKILDARDFSLIPMTPPLQYQFAGTTREGSEWIEGILPVVTKMARLVMRAVVDLPGYADILTRDGQYIGDCNVRGMVDLEDDPMQEATFVQLGASHHDGVGSTCTVMLVQLHELPDRLAQELAAQCVCPSTSQHMEHDDRLRETSEGDCPASLAVGDSIGFGPEQLYLGTRRGVGHVEFARWRESPLEDRGRGRRRGHISKNPGPVMQPALASADDIITDEGSAICMNRD